MTESAVPVYPMRKKLDGSLDSLCLNCLATIPTAKHEIDLDRYEAIHVCHPSFFMKRVGSNPEYSN